MKNILLVTFLSFIILSCVNKKDDAKSTDNNMSVKEMTTDDSLNIAPEFQKGADLIAESDCLACHKINERAIGPSYQEVAAKYTTADVDRLVATIINGGVGNWGEIPMAAHSDLPAEDAKEMVKYILSLR